MECSSNTRMLRVLLSVLLAHLMRIHISSNALSVRVVNGQDGCSGAVELSNGTVRDDYWDLNDAKVVCSQLGCGAALGAPRDSCFRRRSGTICWDLGCLGSESSLSECKPQAKICQQYKAAGVVCRGSNPLSTPSISSSNPAVLPGETVRITCSRSPQKCTDVDFHWYRNRVEIQSKKSKGSELTLSNMAASHQGLYTCSFSYPGTGIQSPLSRHMNISVVSLHQPNISLISEEEGGTLCPPNPQRSEGTVRPQTLEVTKGYNFSMVCSSAPQGYTGGSFRLLLRGSNQTWSQSAEGHSAWSQSAEGHSAWSQSAEGHSACFLLQADDSHQGNYSCVYEVTVGSRLFTSTLSQLLTVTVKDSWLLYLLVAGGLVLLFLLLLSIFIVWKCCLGNRRKRASLNEAIYAGGPEGGVTYRRNEPVEDDERDYESVDDEDKGDYVNTETLGGMDESLEDEEDYVNTETLGSREQGSAEEEDYVNTQTLGGGVEDYECMERHSEDSDGEDYVNVDPLSAGIY
ncbi:deleted in malignant brain tumors 1 protein-like [Sardina pilchardus]|uniref:deleted in malignant brain tumors 1 protein-like n=1 Tax=Sardina pilchardus TaxID=27697 RepID=UPI002E1082F1